jgi:thiol-disulfide isomerase/thioredoxin
MMIQKPALILFHATWCPHCRAVYPAFNRAAKTVGGGGDISVYRIDIDDDAEGMAKKFGVTSFPTIVFVNARGRKTVYAGDRSSQDIARFAQSLALT